MARPHVRDFLDSFVRPLVAGGEVHVGAPIPPGELAVMGEELDAATPALVAVDDARAEVLAPLVCRPPALVLGAEELALACGLHNALFLAHPRAEAWSVRDRVRRRILDAALAMVSQPLTRQRDRVLGRHGLLHNLFRLQRRDVAVRWWAGEARFRGQAPPSRLTAWRGVRRVHEDVTVTTFEELLAVPETAPVIATLVRRTPLTHLLDNHPGAPPLHWEDAVFVLRDAELARALAARLIPDAAPREQVLGPARLAAAFEQMLERAPAEADLRAVAAFLVYLAALLALGEADRREADARSPLLASVLAPDGAGPRPRGLSTLLALPGALALVDPRLAAPPGLDGVPGLAARWRAHRAQAAEALGEPVVDALAARLRRHLRGAPAPDAPAPAPVG